MRTRDSAIPACALRLGRTCPRCARAAFGGQCRLSKGIAASGVPAISNPPAPFPPQQRHYVGEWHTAARLEIYAFIGVSARGSPLNSAAVPFARDGDGSLSVLILALGFSARLRPCVQRSTVMARCAVSDSVGVRGAGRQVSFSNRVISCDGIHQGMVFSSGPCNGSLCPCSAAPPTVSRVSCSMHTCGSGSVTAPSQRSCGSGLAMAATVIATAVKSFELSPRRPLFHHSLLEN
ncbi:hypothetical protein AAFF_G00008420 [Aldrovandia affinis]|uniref:Uncharacterized protein n=1 Tax=Aldrovandia affinis TaxID=143900 RepID=A0AAD7T651_9TELE|nr:hypothetical protein AAFF_G00008420 [Aldrovandia affinis]